jgi:hypothetical protein
VVLEIIAISFNFSIFPCYFLVKLISCKFLARTISRTNISLLQGKIIASGSTEDTAF